jgi:hypothetical protein
MPGTKRIAIFYLAHVDGPDRSPVSLGPVTFPPNVAYVRSELVDATSLEAALSKAAPRYGEVVMNTHYVWTKDNNNEHHKPV